MYLWVLRMSACVPSVNLKTYLCLHVFHPCISDAYLPGCELCGISASALSTGRTASWTCCCSRRHVCAPSQRTASAPCARWSWSPHLTWSHRSPTSTVLQKQKRGREWEKDREGELVGKLFSSKRTEVLLAKCSWSTISKVKTLVMQRKTLG